MTLKTIWNLDKICSQLYVTEVLGLFLLVHILIHLILVIIESDCIWMPLGTIVSASLVIQKYLVKTAKDDNVDVGARDISILGEIRAVSI